MKENPLGSDQTTGNPGLGENAGVGGVSILVWTNPNKILTTSRISVTGPGKRRRNERGTCVSTGPEKKKPETDDLHADYL